METPNSHKIRRILTELVQARTDADPEVCWGSVQVRRYQKELYLMPVLTDVDETLFLSWSGTSALELPDDLGSLEFESASKTLGRLSVGFRREGLKCAPAGREGSRSFKRLAQDFLIPPWLRNRVPLLFIDDQLAAVGDYCICEPFNQHDFKLRWNRPEHLCP